eukprot:COSAG02_NODE_51619_length_313_cov_0.672897_1_plen_52_part_01
MMWHYFPLIPRWNMCSVITLSASSVITLEKAATGGWGGVVLRRAAATTNSIG